MGISPLSLSLRDSLEDLTGQLSATALRIVRQQRSTQHLVAVSGYLLISTILGILY
jgi:hypothetical protein